MASPSEYAADASRHGNCVMRWLDERLGFGFSGYLLSWNMLALFATKVGTQITGAAQPALASNRRSH